MYFQDLILTLQRYWNDKGCLFVQPYDMEKGAATFNPATWLRALGPEPFAAAFAEPCRRPTDGRYGENPIRMQHYYQYQVVLKPSPPNILDLYLGSLEAIGVTSDQHDIRFVHDDWESPTLGAWGLGWEVWVDGMEVTQFTYFQQVGGIELSPVTGEITYGLERLCMYLQGKESVYELDYNAQFTYGDIFQRNEVLGSRHNFEQADVQLHLDLFKRYEAECGRLCELENPVSAADYCLKASHSFNLLDARGAISVNERQNYILKVRTLARQVAEAWLADREALGFPWMQRTAKAIPPKAPATPTEPGDASALPTRAPLLVELGVEEMPAAVFAPLLEQLPRLFAKHIGAAELEAEDVRFFVTPRRIAISVGSMLTRQPDRVLEVKGPPVRVARDKDGNWTKAATGFAERQGLTADALEEREIDGAAYLYASVAQTGRPAVELLAELIPALFADIHWYKTMRWGSGTTSFVRPVQWLVAVLGDVEVPATFAGITATRATWGHRFLSNYDFALPDGARDTYLDTLRNVNVIADHDERRELLRHALEERASELGLRWRRDEELLAEVTNLIEFPHPVVCAFDPASLEIPDAVLVTEMKAHQKYLALEQADGTLSNNFVAVSNTICTDMNLVREGYQNVLKSRFADARFFLAEDMKKPLVERLDALGGAIFQAKLGTILDKVRRIQSLSEYLGETLKVDAAERETVARIAELCKADLTTAMVYEFPELQGEVGRYYAIREGQPQAIADGIRDHYKPKGASDDMPGSDAAAIVGLADRVDSLVGIFGIGKAPKSTADPFGLRRACLTSVALLFGRGFRLDLRALVARSAEIYGDTLTGVDREALVAQVMDFTLTRVQGMLEGEPRPGQPGGFKRDSILAVVGASSPWYDLVDLTDRIQAMEQFRGREDFLEVAATFKRVNNICDATVTGTIDAALFQHAEEGELLAAVDAATVEVQAALAQRDYVGALSAIVPVRSVMDRYFVPVMVNDPDPALRQNRHLLLKRIVDLVLPIADFAAIQEG